MSVQSKNINPVISADCYTGKETVIDIPPGEKRVGVHFCVESGPVEVYYNSYDNRPPLRLYEGARWNQRFFDDSLSKILIKPYQKGSFKVWVIIERV